MTQGLTKLQGDLLATLKACEDAGLPPLTHDEMATALGLRSARGIHRVLHSLEKRGAIRRQGSGIRTVRLTREIGAPRPKTESGEPMQAELVALVDEAKRHAKPMLGADDGQCTAHVLAIWLWCALHGTSPGFLPRDAAGPTETGTGRSEAA